MTTATDRREYKLAADATLTNYGQHRRDVLEFADGQRGVILNVANDDAVDVLEALRRAYRAGREDRAAEIMVAKNDVIGIVPEAGPRRTMLVSRVEHHIITLADIPGE